MTAAVASISCPRSPNLVLVTLPLRVCGNCRYWKGTRLRNGRSGFVCLADIAGTCCDSRRAESGTPADTTPLSNSDCSCWKSGL
jgi:hypothetical protein